MSVQTQPIATIPCKLITDYYPDKASPTLVDEVKPIKEFIQEGPENEEKSTKSTEEGNWVYYVLNTLSAWILTQPHQPEPQREYNEQELWQDWEWILSKTEEFTLLKKAEEGQRIQNELHHLRTVASVMQFRSYFHNTWVHPLYSQHANDPEWNNAVSTVLDASKVSKIIADVIKIVENQWLNSIKEIFFSTKHSKRWFLFRDSYAEKPYERNVVGSLKELAFSASSGSKAGISEKVMVDIIWSLWKTLLEVIRAAIGSDLEPNQMKALADTVAIVKDPLVELWIQTATKSKGGRAREGQLVEKWKEDEVKKGVQLAAIKAKGVDAKWSPTFYNPQVALTESQLDIKMLRNFLETNLLLSRQ